MLDLNILENMQDHEKITKLEGSNFNKYKSIALIHLGRYKDALEYVVKGSYEAAYIYYKLKNYKKALKIISRFSDEESEVLKSQILYSIGFYNKAYEVLVKLPKDDEIVVNLQAMKSMAILADKVNKSCGHKLWMKSRDNLIEFDNLEKHAFVSNESKIEFYFNKTFEEAYDVDKYLEALKTTRDIVCPNLESMITKQISNMEGTFDEIDVDSLSKTHREILLYNMNKIEKLENPIHFLKNFTGNMSDSEYTWLCYAKSQEYNLNPFSIPNTTDNLRLLRIFVGLKNKRMVKNIVLKEIEGLSNDKLKNYIKAYYLEESEDSEITPKMANLTI